VQDPGRRVASPDTGDDDDEDDIDEPSIRGDHHFEPMEKLR
jgi:hypothetical protein